MPADSSVVDAAMVATLVGDATLAGYLPDGVFFDEAPQGATRFAIVSQQDHEDTYTQDPDVSRSAFETFVYLVKAVVMGTSGSASGSNVKDAAARIHALLQGGTLGSLTGYRLRNLQRLERVRYTEDDDQSDRRWQHRGGLYQVLVEPL